MRERERKGKNRQEISGDEKGEAVGRFTPFVALFSFPVFSVSFSPPTRPLFVPLLLEESVKIQ